MRTIRNQILSRFELYCFETLVLRCTSTSRKARRVIKLLLLFDVFKGAISLIFLLLFLMLQVYEDLSALQNTLVVSSCAVFTLHIWIVSTFIRPIFRNPSDFQAARKFALGKFVFSLLMLVLLVGSSVN